MGKIWCSISNHKIINKYIPLSLLDKHSEAIHSLFPTLTHRVEVRPFQNQQFWCYFCHPIVNFLVWDLYDCNEKILFSVLHILYCFLHKKQDHPKIYSTITTVIKIIIVKMAKFLYFSPQNVGHISPSPATIYAGFLTILNGYDRSQGQKWFDEKIFEPLLELICLFWRGNQIIRRQEHVPAPNI